jgi:hypothetical protein
LKIWDYVSICPHDLVELEDIRVLNIAVDREAMMDLVLCI